MTKKIDCWVILNRSGNLWTTKIFRTKYEAQEHVEKFWKNIPNGKNLTEYKYIKAKMTYDRG